MSKMPKVQILYSDEGTIREAIPVTTENKDNNPIKQVIDVMKKVDTSAPDAKENEVSIKDKDGKRIKLDDEPVRNTYFRGVYYGNNLRAVEQDKKK